MAAVKGIKEKVHLPLYDSVSIKPTEQLNKILSSNVLRFFLDVTGKTKLQTNMQASALLPHWNTYEARAMRVVISDLAAQFPETPTVNLSQVRVVDITGQPDPESTSYSHHKQPYARQLCGTQAANRGAAYARTLAVAKRDQCAKH